MRSLVRRSQNDAEQMGQANAGRAPPFQSVAIGPAWLSSLCGMKWTSIMYIERKAGALTGDARIGRVTSNRTGRTLFYRDHVFRRIVGGGFKSNYVDEATGEDHWISGYLHGVRYLDTTNTTMVCAAIAFGWVAIMVLRWARKLSNVT